MGRAGAAQQTRGRTVAERPNTFHLSDGYVSEALPHTACGRVPRKGAPAISWPWCAGAGSQRGAAAPRPKWGSPHREIVPARQTPAGNAFPGHRHFLFQEENDFLCFTRALNRLFMIQPCNRGMAVQARGGV